MRNPCSANLSCYKAFLILCVSTFQLHLCAQPVITSLVPASGKIGDTITVNGSGFGSSSAANIAFFGGVKAAVLSATATQLTVQVPYGATYQPVSVTTSNLTAYSAKKFNVIYARPGGIIPGAIEPPKTFTGGTAPSSLEAADMDGDGKTDLIMANDEASTLSIFRNNATTGFGFDTAYDRPLGGRAGNLTLADFNGDGKLDIAIITSNPVALKIFRNISTPGAILLDTAITYPSTVTTFTYYSRVKAGDIDLDGKPDIVLSEYTQLSVFRNNGSAATALSFEPKKDFSIGSNPIGIDISDMDGNGKPDVVVAVSDNRRIAILSNTSTPGIITLTAQQSITTDVGPTDVVAGDMDGDGKPDLTMLTSSGQPTLSVYRNSSTGSGSFQFDAGVTVKAASSARECKLNDVDGDGKPDIAYIGEALNLRRLNVVKNKSVAGSVSLAPYLTMGYSFLLNVLAFGDFDGDGKADIAGGDYRAGTYLVFRNKSNEPIISSFTPTVGTTGSIDTIKGLNLSGTTTVKFGNMPAAAFTVVSDSVIAATIGQGETGYITVTSPRGAFVSREDFGFNIPVINSFAPQSGSIGTTVTIAGNNFSPVATNNIVYFGGVRATVQTATATTVTVAVPAGAGYQPITVTVGKRTAATTKPFTITFPAARPFDSTAFAARADITITGKPYDMAVTDFDNDGKPDLAVSNNTTNNLSILRNTSTGNTLSFTSTTIAVPNSSQNFIAAGDLNGDGKPDIVIANTSWGNLNILANTTTASNISFSQVTSTDTFPNTQQYVYGASGLSIIDFDGDGKPDIGVGTGTNTAFASFFRNISRGDTILFAPLQNIPSAIFPYDFVSGDVDGDGKPEAIVTNYNTNTLSVYKNNSIPGSLLFAPKIDSATAAQPYRAGMADIDGDGKLDIAVSAYGAGAVSVLRNTSAGGNISFARKTDFSTAAGTFGISINDLDGDGKPDIATSSSTGNSMAILRNTSTAGAIRFAARLLYATGGRPYIIRTADLNGDGAPELVSVNYDGASISLFRNKLLDTFIVAVCPPVASTSITSNITGNAYQWQVDTGSGFVNLADTGSYSGSQSRTLQLNNIPSAWHGYRYRCLVSGSYSSVAILKVRNRWTGVVSNAWENAANWSCGTVPDANTDVMITSGAVVLSSNTTCGSVTVTAPGSLTVTAGNVLTVTR